jgi:hypothetical protein
MKGKAVLLCLIPLFLMGCWNAEEINDRVIVLAAGMDQVENGRVRLSLQVPIVEEVLPIYGSPQVSKHPFGTGDAQDPPKTARPRC